MCNHLGDSDVAEDVRSFLKALTGPPFFAKVVITSRFGQTVRYFLDDILVYRSLSVSRGIQTRSESADYLSHDDRGM
jgi:hypothetical protein